VYSVIEERVAAGRTVFLSSHVLSEVERVCDRIGIIRSGHLVAEEGVKALLGKRLREVEVTFAEPVDAGLLGELPGVDSVVALSGQSLSARVRGEAIDDVLKRIAGRKVSDIRIQHASLEDVFLEFYRADDVAPTNDEGGEAS
jgi:ABC-2 type transport system ATP-binding protein